MCRAWFPHWLSEIHNSNLDLMESLHDASRSAAPAAAISLVGLNTGESAHLRGNGSHEQGPLTAGGSRLSLLGLTGDLVHGVPNRSSVARQSAGVSVYLQSHGFSTGNSGGDQTMPGSQPGAWTVFVNLAANAGLGNSALRIDQQLQEERLIQLTKDKPIKIIVQTTLNQDEKLNSTDISSAAGSPQRIDMDHTAVIRYEISNGTKRLLSSGPTQGMVRDLSQLLSADADALKAQHLMLINEAHGNNANGFLGDSGMMFPEEFADTARQALRAAGRSKFDVLDLVGCETADAQQLSMLGHVAKYIVGSEEPEFADIRHDELMQPVAATIENLAQHVDMDPLRVARDFLAVSSRACVRDSQRSARDGLHWPCVVNALSVIDGEAASKVPAALNQLGASLLSVLPLGDNEQKIRNMIADLPSAFSGRLPGSADARVGSQHRDLGMFIEDLRKGLGSGTIKDTASGDLARSLDAISHLLATGVKGNFNSPDLGSSELNTSLSDAGLPPERLSGVSTVIPETFDPKRIGFDFLSASLKEIDRFREKVKDDLQSVVSRQDLENLQIALQQSRAMLQQITLGHAPNEPAVQAISQFIQVADSYSDWLATASTLPEAALKNQFQEQDEKFSDQSNQLLANEDVWTLAGPVIASIARQNVDYLMPGNGRDGRTIDNADTIEEWKRFADRMMSS